MERDVVNENEFEWFKSDDFTWAANADHNFKTGGFLDQARSRFKRPVVSELALLVNGGSFTAAGGKVINPEDFYRLVAGAWIGAGDKMLINGLNGLELRLRAQYKLGAGFYDGLTQISAATASRTFYIPIPFSRPKAQGTGHGNFSDNVVPLEFFLDAKQLQFLFSSATLHGDGGTVNSATLQLVAKVHEGRDETKKFYGYEHWRTYDIDDTNETFEIPGRPIYINAWTQSTGGAVGSYTAWGAAAYVTCERLKYVLKRRDLLALDYVQMGAGLVDTDNDEIALGTSFPILTHEKIGAAPLFAEDIRLEFDALPTGSSRLLVGTMIGRPEESYRKLYNYGSVVEMKADLAANGGVVTTKGTEPLDNFLGGIAAHLPLKVGSPKVQRAQAATRDAANG